MAEPVNVQCHRCGYEFVSIAATRTQCTRCKMNLRVGREGYVDAGGSSEHVAAGGWAAIVGIVIAVAVMLWGGRRP